MIIAEDILEPAIQMGQSYYQFGVPMFMDFN
jgi:hypothetical protein